MEVVFHPGGDQARIQHIRSEDGGVTFAAAMPVWESGESGDEQRNAHMAFDSLGRLHVVWAQGGARPMRVLHSISLNGVSFTAPTRLSGAWNESSMGLREWEDHPTIIPTPNGGLVATFSGKMNNTMGIWFTKLVNEPPVVTISYPSDGLAVRGTVPVLGTAIDTAGTTSLGHIFVQVGDADVVQMRGTTSWEHEFDSTVLPDGMLEIKAWASDGYLIGPVATVTVDVDNNVPPTFSIGAGNVR